MPNLDAFTPTWKHAKRGSCYKVQAVLELPRPDATDGDRISLFGKDDFVAGLQISNPEALPAVGAPMRFILYKDADTATFWLRPETEFLDGRFVMF